MITCDYIGRLGNQMFQTAAAVSLATDIGTEFRAPMRSLNPTEWPTYFATPRSFNPMTSIVTYREPFFHYKELPHRDNIKIHGYFQSEKYFKHNLDVVKKTFRWIPLDRINGSCSIHIRRGDYLQFADKHPPITEEYIDTAISLMVDYGIETFLIFGDDQDYNVDLSKRLRFKVKTVVCSMENPIDDMRMMAACDHNIISNSTFSWWGAYLNTNPNKIVITPHRDNWFGPGNAHLDTRDIIPDTWLQINPNAQRGTF